MCQKLPYCTRKIDPCLTDIITEINNTPNLKTLSSCCGHGKYESTIVVIHKPSSIVYEHHSQVYLGHKQRPGNRYYKKDGKAKRDHYYIPEVRDQLPTILIAKPFGPEAGVLIELAENDRLPRLIPQPPSIRSFTPP